MHEWKDVEKGRRDGEQSSLDERLAAYYGPRLREQPLPASSWQRLSSRLGLRRPQRHWRLRVPRLRRHRRRYAVPTYIQDTFERILHEARVSYPLSLLRCSFNPNMHIPTVRVSTLGRHPIKLTMPSPVEGVVGKAELNVLLATGLARYFYKREAEHVVVRVLLGLAFLLALVAAILFVAQAWPIAVLPIAIMLCAVWLLHPQGRRLAFRADRLMVLWLGREQVCQGLHALADRSRSSRRRKWGEPSLEERIERVCGTRVAVEDERLTLVR